MNFGCSWWQDMVWSMQIPSDRLCRMMRSLTLAYNICLSYLSYLYSLIDLVKLCYVLLVIKILDDILAS